MSDQAGKTDLLQDTIELCRVMLDSQTNNPQALRVLERLLNDDDPGDIHAARRTVAETFELVFQRSSDWKSLARVLEIRLETCVEGEIRKSLLLRLRNIYENQLDEPVQAFGALARAFNENPQSEPVHQEIRSLAFKHRMLEELVGVYLDQIDRASAGAGALELNKEVAALLEKELGDLEGAILHWETLLAANPNDAEVQSNIERLYRQTGRTAQLASLYRACFGLPEEVEKNLEGLLSSPTARLSAAKMLEPYYRRVGDYAKLAKVLEIALEEEKDPARRLACFRELIDIHDSQLDQKSFAFIVACRAFREHPTDRGLGGQLERLAQETQSVEELEMLYEEVLPNAVVPGETEDLLRNQARLLSPLPGQRDKALSLWWRVLAQNPKDIEALGALEKLLREAGDFQGLVDVLKQKVATVPEMEKKKDLYYEIASLLEDELGQSEEAIQIYLNVLAIDPHDPTAMKLVQRLFVASKTAKDAYVGLQRAAVG